MGALLVKLCEPEIARLAAAGEDDTRCVSCAFRLGTVPNGCPQTMLDAIKAVAEDVPFFCHATKVRCTKICHGWFASKRVVMHRGNLQILLAGTEKYQFSPPDEDSE